MLHYPPRAPGTPRHVGWYRAMHIIKKRQVVVEEWDEGLTAAEHFYALAPNHPTDQLTLPQIVSHENLR